MQAVPVHPYPTSQVPQVITPPTNVHVLQLAIVQATHKAVPEGSGTYPAIQSQDPLTMTRLSAGLQVVHPEAGPLKHW